MIVIIGYSLLQISNSNYIEKKRSSDGAVPEEIEFIKVHTHKFLGQDWMINNVQPRLISFFGFSSKGPDNLLYVLIFNLFSQWQLWNAEF